MLHLGIAAWVLSPSKAIAIPQQQVMQVDMVAPSPLPQPEPVQAESTPLTPPKETGLKKVTPELKKKAAAIPPEIVQPKREQMPPEKADTAPTSGKTAEYSEHKKAAVTEPLFNANYLNNTPPVYPRSARRHNIQGTVLLKVLVSAEGQAKHVAIASSSGSSALDEAARKAVEGWRFVPARRGSEPVEASVRVPIEFKLR